MAAAMKELWLVASGASASGKADLLSSVKSSLYRNVLCEFKVPDGGNALKFGSFDDLSRLVDDLAKADNSLDSITHRLERQLLELDPKQKLSIQSKGSSMSFEDYLKAWEWDEAKYSREFPVVKILEDLQKGAALVDDRCRKEMVAYNDIKQQKTNLAEKESPLLAGRDMDDIITPAVVDQFRKESTEQPFYYTDYFTSVCLALAKGAQKDFLSEYEQSVNDVVPQSAKKFPVDDKDGNSMWRVVLFKTAKEGFMKWCREKRYIVRDFEYDGARYEKRIADRRAVSQKEEQLKKSVVAACGMAWSDAMTCWTHVKAMRLCVECAMRYGATSADVHIAAMVIRAPDKAAPARRALASILEHHLQPIPYKNARGAEKVAEDDDEMFPYVSLSMTPFAVGK